MENEEHHSSASMEEFDYLSQKSETLAPSNSPHTKTSMGTSFLDWWGSWKRDLYSIWWSLNRKLNRMYRWMCSFYQTRPLLSSRAAEEESNNTMQHEIYSVVKDINSGNEFVLNITKPVDPLLLRSNIPPVHRKHLPPKLSLVATPGTVPRHNVVVLEDWINPLLSQKTQLMLQSELCNSDSFDCPGYICVFSYEEKKHSLNSLGSNAHSTSLIQISRVSDLKRHLHDHSSHCRYRRSLLEIFPSPSKSSKPCQVSFKIERLIHKELEESFNWLPGINCEACGLLHENWLHISSEDWDDVRGSILRWIEYSRVIYS
ncbi:GIY-YIGT nuclease superfamily protein [Schizosaccharomyces osmophilus]|uniref:GIY-YIGT nuclease superfamily protein n=1 Tax=Schizosaccharomyces osmophilus TaxID=2545709 RepID=A0AAF0AUL9_9SCHI|nr:GIY-YIGT nuclease superfamily protein [Schizosaccharomyces osmophilus]WBW71014.1 GIY-YIGT nuclease superfamily protein [Schizosaccharomyces osmophilus]